jgi:hypothetical protein
MKPLPLVYYTVFTILLLLTPSDDQISFSAACSQISFIYVLLLMSQINTLAGKSTGAIKVLHTLIFTVSRKRTARQKNLS